MKTFSIGVSVSSSSSFGSEQMNQFANNISRKIIHKKGGDLYVLESNITRWQASLKENPVILRRFIENMTSFIQSDKINELTEIELAKLRQEINKAVEIYVERNYIYGCMDSKSPSFNWIANVDDGSCKNPNETAKFGGFIRTCDEEWGLYR